MDRRTHYITWSQESAEAVVPMINRRREVIYIVGLWDNGYKNMTPLEFRLAFNIRANTFYKYADHPSPWNIYPCNCLKRQAGRHRQNVHLHGALEGWYARKQCFRCKGTGVSEYGAWSLSRREAEAMVARQKRSA